MNADLLRRWQAGDEAAGSLLFARELGRLRRFFRTRVHNADELVQRTFVACLESLDSLQRPESFRAFLFTIAHRQFAAQCRARRVPAAEITVRSLRDSAASPSTVVRVRDERSLVREALRRLPVDLQLVIELHYWEDFTAKEVAEVIGVPTGTVKTRIRRAKHLLRRAMAGDQGARLAMKTSRPSIPRSRPPATHTR